MDNHSSSEHVDALSQLGNEFENVTVILNDINLGYFKGLNVGIRHLRAAHPEVDVIIVGNNDLVFPEDFAQSLARAQRLFTKYAVVAPDIVTLDGVHQNPHIISGVSRVRQFVHGLYYANYWVGVVIRDLARLTRRFSTRSDQKQHPNAQEVYQGLGACYLLTRLFFDRFEELWAPTFMMHEEFFISKQLNDIGLRIYYEPAIKVLHHVKGAMGSLPSRKAWEAARDSYKIYRHYMRRSG